MSHPGVLGPFQADIGLPSGFRPVGSRHWLRLCYVLSRGGKIKVDPQVGASAGELIQHNFWIFEILFLFMVLAVQELAL